LPSIRQRSVRVALRVARHYIGIVNERVDRYIARSVMWPDEMTALRLILLECGLREDIKWGKPCFSLDSSNIAILQEMKGFLSLMFFKGALLKDPTGLLVEQGPNSRSAKRVEFTSVDDVNRLSKALVKLINDAINIERSGERVGPAPQLELVAELQERLDSDKKLQVAFDSLTPGRKREYNLHFSDAKQPKTRVARIEACVAKILAGKGFRDR
jgi:uncharacterized protein YdeI (YjbR/CyaY-like superfamily)